MQCIRNRDAVPYIRERKDFSSHTKSFRGDTQTNGDYVVYSYATEIARFVVKTGRWEVNATKYSQTTSSHQSIVWQAVWRAGGELWV